LFTSLLSSVAASHSCTLPAGTEGADDGNPHCWDRIRRCDGPEAHPDDGPGYSPACGPCEGLGGPAWGDKNEQIKLPKCSPITVGENDTAPVHPAWASMGGNGKFSIENDRFIMIGKKTDPFCFSFFPSNNSAGNQCYRRQTGKFQVDMSGEQKSVRYDLNLHIPWPSDRFSLFGNISTTIFHHGPNMWIVNNLYNLMKQCVCVQPLSGGSGTGGSHNPTPIFPVMHNWTDHLTYLAREKLEIEYGVGEMEVDHWTYGPHHAWTPVGSNEIVRMWQPYNGFEVFEPGAFKPGHVDAMDFMDMVPPPQCKKDGGALARITCTDDGFPTNKSERESIPADTADIRRARTKVPREHAKATTFGGVTQSLNNFVRQYKNVKECSEWTTLELQRFQAMMMMLKSAELNDLYMASGDARALRGDEDTHGFRWERLNNLASILGAEDVQRDGHCHEAVMWFVHHVPETLRNHVADAMAVPLLPYTQHSCDEKHEVCEEYLKQVSCQDCHRDADIPQMTV